MIQKISAKHIELLDAISKVPGGQSFKPKDLNQKFGYPYKDAAKLLQQSCILGVYVSYALGYPSASSILYTKTDLFDFLYKQEKLRS